MPETKNSLEILIATMNRSNLDFLNTIFPFNYVHLNILIVNQTTAEKVISSNQKNIKVINSFEKGLSKSRNLALKNATASICLFSDDDVVFLADFDKKIIKAFTDNPSNAVITFQTLTTTGKLFWDYPKQSGKHHKLNKILSHEIAVKREILLNKSILFDEYFGLGATFEDAENYIFLKEIASKIDKPYFIKECIAIHTELTSSDEIASDRHTYARAALLYKYKKNIAYLYIVKLIFFLLRTKRISLKQISHKWQVASAGIKQYKKIK